MSTKFNPQTFTKLQRIANRVRESKGWKPGTIAARSESKSDTGSLYVYQLIGSNWFEEGITADSVRTALEGLRGVKNLDIFINSEGGDVFEAKAIYTQLLRFNAKKTVYIDGIAASAATFVAMAGDRIITAPAANWMIHEAWGMAMGEAQDLRDYADVLELQNADIASIYAQRTGQPLDAIRKMMADETWMNADKALELKFTDEVTSYDDDSADTQNSKPSKFVNAAETTRERIAQNMAAVMQFKASLVKQQEKQEPSRASPVKRVNGKPV